MFKTFRNYNVKENKLNILKKIDLLKKIEEAKIKQKAGNSLEANQIFQGLLKSKKNKSKWNMKSHFKSKSYTTNWNQLLIVK